MNEASTEVELAPLRAGLGEIGPLRSAVASDRLCALLAAADALPDIAFCTPTSYEGRFAEGDLAPKLETIPGGFRLILHYVDRREMGEEHERRMKSGTASLSGHSGLASHLLTWSCPTVRAVLEVRDGAPYRWVLEESPRLCSVLYLVPPGHPALAGRAASRRRLLLSGLLLAVGLFLLAWTLI